MSRIKLTFQDLSRTFENPQIKSHNFTNLTRTFPKSGEEILGYKPNDIPCVLLQAL